MEMVSRCYTVSVPFIFIVLLPPSFLPHRRTSCFRSDKSISSFWPMSWYYINLFYNVIDLNVMIKKCYKGGRFKIVISCSWSVLVKKNKLGEIKTSWTARRKKICAWYFYSISPNIDRDGKWNLNRFISYLS